MANNKVVLVTGASGFVGQHIVKLLQEQEKDIQEIRVFDVKPYQNTLAGYEESTPVKSVVADIRKLSDVQKAVQGCSIVIHTAAVIQIGTCIDEQYMYDVNVKGTENILQACLDQGVTRLVCTSSVDAVKDCNSHINATEEESPYPSSNDFIFPGYGRTKCKAEKLIIDAHGREHTSGRGNLHTIILRPTGIYGDGNWVHGPAEVLKNSKKRGFMRTTGFSDGLFQLTYVGNVAWAHLIAYRVLAKNSSVGGQAYFVTDDTPYGNFYETHQPFLDAKGYRYSEKEVSFILIWFLAYIFEIICFLLQPFKRIQSDFCVRSLYYVRNKYSFNRDKISKKLGYEPLYSAAEAMQNSVEFYRKLPL